LRDSFSAPEAAWEKARNRITTERGRNRGDKLQSTSADELQGKGERPGDVEQH